MVADNVTVNGRLSMQNDILCLSGFSLKTEKILANKNLKLMGKTPIGQILPPDKYAFGS